MQPIDPQCVCTTCAQYSRAFLHRTATREPVAAQLITVHNLHYMSRLCARMRKEIQMGRFQQFAVDFLKQHFPAEQAPAPVWIREALMAAGFDLALLESVEWELTSLRVREREGSADVEPAPKRVK
ncbi:MAG: hypothetical protein KVP17_000068 [Porospora cf. gigantea B]|nr:MAG: hypothetical protein KVP17_000068 [Porospora cf. gigantea B]